MKTQIPMIFFSLIRMKIGKERKHVRPIKKVFSSALNRNVRGGILSDIPKITFIIYN